MSQCQQHWSPGRGRGWGGCSWSCWPVLPSWLCSNVSSAPPDGPVPQWHHLPTNPCLSFQHVCSAVPPLQSARPSVLRHRSSSCSPLPSTPQFSPFHLNSILGCTDCCLLKKNRRCQSNIVSHEAVLLSQMLS